VVYFDRGSGVYGLFFPAAYRSATEEEDSGAQAFGWAFDVGVNSLA
jgi:hypothetical protein